MKKTLLALVMFALIASPALATWTAGTPALVGEYYDQRGGSKMIVFSVLLTADGSAGTYTFTSGMMEKIQGLYLYAVKFEIPVSDPPEATFTFDVQDEDGFSWLDLNAVATSDSAYGGDDTQGFFPPVSGTWSLAIGDIGGEGDNFTVYFYFVK